MYDLMTIFSKNYYVDPAFKGSASIKKVLPVLVPELSYEDMNISKGDQASERWERLVSKDTSKEEKEVIAGFEETDEVIEVRSKGNEWKETLNIGICIF